MDCVDVGREDCERFWGDDELTVAKCLEKQCGDPEQAAAQCFALCPPAGSGPGASSNETFRARNTTGCSNSQLDQYFNDCVETTANCSRFMNDSNNVSCTMCLAPGTSGGRGPLIQDGSPPTALNVAGCVDHAFEGPNASKKPLCENDFLSRVRCEASVCGTCWNNGSSSGSDEGHKSFLGCIQLADKAACSPYVAGADACVALLKGTPAQSCVPKNVFDFDKTEFKNVANAFCGNP